MCEQCLTNPFYFGQVVPGYFLVKARRKGNEMELGDWGLVQCNDPMLTFTFNFHNVPNSVEWDDEAWEIWKRIEMHPHAGHQLIQACIEVGYDLADNWVDWFLARIHAFLQEVEPYIDEDPFPHIDAHRPHDYSPWVKPAKWADPEKMQLELFGDE